MTAADPVFGVAGLIPPIRDGGEFTVVEALPEWIVVVFAAVTHLADPWFLFALLAAVYWFGDNRIAPQPRRTGATAIAVVSAGYAAVAAGKAVTAAPRPPAAAGPVDVPGWLPTLLTGWYETQLLSDGFAFPSGHAAGAVVAYGVLAALATGVATPRRRYVAAALLAGAVALSRVAIQVHYLVDVVAGVLVGCLVVGLGLWLAGALRPRAESDRPSPVPVFALAALVSLVAAAVAVGGGYGDEVVEAAVGIGTGVGGLVGWQLVDGDEPPVSVPVAVPGLLVTGGIWSGSYLLADAVVGPTSGLLVTTVGTSVAVAGVVAMPSLVATGRLQDVG